jgi:hypothetical protein
VYNVQGDRYVLVVHDKYYSICSKI